MWKIHIYKTGNWGLKSANNHWLWMCPLKRSLGASLMLPLMAWFTEVAAGMLTFSMLDDSGQAWQCSHLRMCVSVCASLPLSFLGSKKKRKTLSSILFGPVMNRGYIFMLSPENTWNTRGVKVKSGEVFGAFSIFPPVAHRPSERLRLYNHQVTREK